MDQGGCPHCQDVKGATRLEAICRVLQPRGISRQERWVCLLLLCRAPLLSSRWPATKRQGREQRDLYAAPPRAGSRALFSFHPVLLDSMGRNSAPSPTVATQTSILHRGSRDAPPWRGRSQGCYKELIVCRGPGSEQAWAMATGANLSPAGQLGERGRGRPGPAGEG